MDAECVPGEGPVNDRPGGELGAGPRRESFYRIPSALHDHWRRHGGWEPGAISLDRDRRDWIGLSPAEQRILTQVLGQFLNGEVSVSQQLAPIVETMEHEGRDAEVEFLRTFVSDEEKHVRFFRMFFESIVGSTEGPDQYRLPNFRYIFDEALPRDLNALRGDGSPRSQARALSTFCLVCEGVIAETAYEGLHRALLPMDKMPGLLRGLSYVMRDESRHIAYGTYALTRLAREHSSAVLPSLYANLARFAPKVAGAVGEIFDLERPFPFELGRAELQRFALKQLGSRVRVITGGSYRSLEALEEGVVGKMELDG